MQDFKCNPKLKAGISADAADVGSSIISELLPRVIFCVHILVLATLRIGIVNITHFLSETVVHF